MMKESFYMTAGELKPNPKKVALLIAALEERGVKMKTIAEKCGASPSDVSCWKGKAEGKEHSYLPSRDQYEILVSMYQQKVPGTEFHHHHVFKSLEFRLPSDWEKKMVSWYVNEQNNGGWGYYSDTFDEIEKKHFSKLQVSDLDALGASYDVLVQLQQTVEKALTEYDTQIAEAHEVEQKEENAYQAEIESIKNDMPANLSDEDIEKLLARFDVRKETEGEWLKESAESRVRQVVRQSLNSVSDLVEQVLTDDDIEEELRQSDQKLLGKRLLSAVKERVEKRRAADEACYEENKIVGHVDADSLSTLEKKYSSLNIDFSEQIENTNLFTKEQIKIFTGRNEFVEVPLREAFQDWISELSKEEYLSLEEEEVNISGRLIYESKDRDTKFEVFSLYSQHLLLLKTLEWEERNIKLLPSVLTVQDVVDQLGEYADKTYTTFDDDGEQVRHQGLKEALVFNGYSYPGVRVIV